MIQPVQKSLLPSVLSKWWVTYRRAATTGLSCWHLWGLALLSIAVSQHSFGIFIGGGLKVVMVPSST